MPSLSNSSGRAPSTISGDTSDNSSILSGSDISRGNNIGHKQGFRFEDFCRRVSRKIQQFTPPQDRPSNEDIERELHHCIKTAQQRFQWLRTYWLKFDTFHARHDATCIHLAECTSEQCLCFQAALVLPDHPHLLKIEGLLDLWTCGLGCICQPRWSQKHLIDLTDLRDSDCVTSPQLAHDRILALFNNCHSVQEAVDIKL